jgi:hypothetical protein
MMYGLTIGTSTPIKTYVIYFGFSCIKGWGAVASIANSVGFRVVCSSAARTTLPSKGSSGDTAHDNGLLRGKEKTNLH